MSGVVKSIGKVFKKVGKIVKKILPYAIIAAAAIFAAPLLAGALGVGAAGAAGGGAIFAGGPLAGAAVSSGAAITGGAAGGGGIGGFLSSILGGGGSSILGGGGSGSALGSLLSSGTFGSLLAGGARGLMQNMQSKAQDQFVIDRENRAEQRHKISDSSLFDFSGTSQGLGVKSLTNPTVAVRNTAINRPQRPSVTEMAQAPTRPPRYKYNPETGRIDFA